MSVKVRTGAAFKSLLGGQQEVSVEGDTVGTLLNKLGIMEKVCDDSGNLKHHFSIHVNEGEDIRMLDGLNTVVNEGDRVTILSAVAGG